MRPAATRPLQLHQHRVAVGEGAGCARRRARGPTAHGSPPGPAVLVHRCSARPSLAKCTKSAMAAASAGVARRKGGSISIMACNVPIGRGATSVLAACWPSTRRCRFDERIQLLRQHAPGDLSDRVALRAQSLLDVADRLVIAGLGKLECAFQRGDGVIHGAKTIAKDSKVRAQSWPGYRTRCRLRGRGATLGGTSGRRGMHGSGGQGTDNLPGRGLSARLRPHRPHERRHLRHQVRRGQLGAVLRARPHANVSARRAPRHGRRAAEHQLQAGAVRRRRDRDPLARPRGRREAPALPPRHAQHRDRRPGGLVRDSRPCTSTRPRTRPARFPLAVRQKAEALLAGAR